MYSFIFFKILQKVSVSLVNPGGRNFLGRICVFHRGGGNKSRILLIDRFRRLNQYGYVFKILKKAFITAFIGMIVYDNGLISFIVLSHGLFINSRIFSGVINSISCFSLGSSNLLKHYNLFSVINSVELFPFSGFKLVRSAGCSAVLISKIDNFVFLKLSSGWQVKIFSDCASSLGIVSNFLNRSEIIGKAGKNRAYGVRPVVRGVIKNPCDHPHGGGEGKGSPPVSQMSPWGWLTKGRPSLNKKKDRLKRQFFKIF